MLPQVQKHYSSLQSSNLLLVGMGDTEVARYVSICRACLLAVQTGCASCWACIHHDPVPSVITGPVLLMRPYSVFCCLSLRTGRQGTDFSCDSFCP